MLNLTRRIDALEKTIETADQRRLFLIFPISEGDEDSDIDAASQKAWQMYLNAGNDPDIRRVFRIGMKYHDQVSWYIA